MATVIAPFQKFNSFIDAVIVGKFANAFLPGYTDVFKLALTNVEPSPTVDTQFSDITEITAANGYVAGGIDMQHVSVKSGPYYTITCPDLIWTAAGGSFGPFRWLVAYNFSHVDQPLIALWDYGTELTREDTETFKATLSPFVFTLGND